MQLMEWGSVSNNPDIQAAYSAFHRILSEKENVANWVSYVIAINRGSQMSLKKSIKTKNNYLSIATKVITLRKEMPVTKLTVIDYITSLERLNAITTKIW